MRIGGVADRARCGTFENPQLIHLPIHATWLTQIESQTLSALGQLEGGDAEDAGP